MRINCVLFIIASLMIACANPVPRKPLNGKTHTDLKESVSFNKELIASEEAIFKNLMLEDSTRTYLESSLGFWYSYTVKSEQSYLPKIEDKLMYTYTVETIEGHTVYGVDEIGQQTYLVDKQEILEGLRDGLKLMHEGDVITFLFPSHKVFGYSGDQKKVGINQPLIYKVKLNKIEKKDESN